ncbi:Flagellin protein FlaA [hydrothermal vent metagenome]|uniref:Flagellin protein FlaA n=1 Tax=hydrothermal vent metagenome TaxID=652676 RepID=A0A3B0WQX2_9ZZZZ
MALVINSNIMSLNAQRNVSQTNGALATSLQRLSTGLRINSAKDDAAGLYSVERMTADIRGLNQAARNAADGISLAQTAESALGQLSDNLQRIRELAVQASNGTVEDRTGLQTEADLLADEIARTVNAASFNGVQLLDGSATVPLEFQVGQDATDQIAISNIDLDVSTIIAYAGAGAFDLSTADLAQGELTILDGDIDAVSSLRATFGATQNRFESVISSVQSYAENLSASRSRIQDADFAAETANLTKVQIMQQAGIAMLSQANAVPQNVLSLLQ